MKKTDLKLLGLMYPDTAELISELIENSKNPEVALELAVGVYVAPIIPAKIVKDKTELFCLYFDKWEDKVHYSYTELCSPWSDECYSHLVILDEMVTKNDYMDIDRWMKLSEANV